MRVAWPLPTCNATNADNEFHRQLKIANEDEYDKNKHDFNGCLSAKTTKTIRSTLLGATGEQ